MTKSFGSSKKKPGDDDGTSPTGRGQNEPVGGILNRLKPKNTQSSNGGQAPGARPAQPGDENWAPKTNRPPRGPSSDKLTNQHYPQENAGQAGAPPQSRSQRPAESPQQPANPAQQQPVQQRPAQQRPAQQQPAQQRPAQRNPGQPGAQNPNPLAQPVRPPAQQHTPQGYGYGSTYQSGQPSYQNYQQGQPNQPAPPQVPPGYPPGYGAPPTQFVQPGVPPQGYAPMPQSADPNAHLYQANQTWQPEEQAPPVQEVWTGKPKPGRRITSFLFDVTACYMLGALIALILFRLVSADAVGCALLLTRDYFFKGRGIGKNLMGLQVINSTTGAPCSLIESIKRNLFLFAPLVLMQVVPWVLKFIPIPWLVSGSLTVLHAVSSLFVLTVLPYECYRALRRPDGLRLGDAFAGTEIVEAPMDFSSVV